MSLIQEIEITNLTNSIVDNFQPDKIILFGSYAYGSPDENSDLDLLVVMPFEGKSSKKALEIWKKIQPLFSIDLLIKTPDDFKKRYLDGDPLIGDAVDKGRLLYERYN